MGLAFNAAAYEALEESAFRTNNCDAALGVPTLVPSGVCASTLLPSGKVGIEK